MRAGYAALLGRPNSGRSTLLNSMTGRVVSPATPYPGTTRVPLSGIASPPGCQICLIDTPSTASGLPECLEWVDAACMVVDARTSGQTLDSPWSGEVRRAMSGRPLVLALSHVDCFPRSLWTALVNQAASRGGFDRVLVVCPPRGDGSDELAAALGAFMPSRGRLFPVGCTTLHSERFLVAEAIRTELYQVLPGEIASTTAVQIEEFSIRDGRTYVRANLVVSRHAFKGMVIGRRGQTLQRIVECSVEAAARLLGRSITPDLWVKVREAWNENRADLLEFGYVL